MIILIDTREQLPLDFNHLYITETQSKGLKVGDYGCQYVDGYIPPVFFERKSLGDLFGTMGKGYPRFKRSLLRAKELKFKLILLVEATLTKVLKGYTHSTMTGISIVRKLMTLQIKYDMDFQFCKDRGEMSRYITEYYCALGRLKGKRVGI